MADALVSPAVGGIMYACSAAVAAYSVRKIKLEADPLKVPVMGVMGAFVFAAQMINFSIPGTGSSGHLCGGMLLTALLEPYASFLTLLSVLLIQCLLFADGGLLALGANVWNMAFYGCIIAFFCVWKPVMKNGLSKGKVVAASIIGSVLSLQLGSFSVTLQTLASGNSELPFSVFLGVMQPIHLAIGLVEGLITAAVLIFIYEARPELLQAPQTEGRKNRFSLKKVVIILGIVAVLTGGVLSHFASSSPDGLEWSIEKTSGQEELEAEGDIYERAQSVQEKTSFLPDYAFKDSDTSAGTSFSGIFGALAVVLVCAGVCLLVKWIQKRNSKA